MRLLLVEDNPKLVRSISRGLRAEGYAVDVATDGDAALIHAGVWEYDGVILDLMLPVRDGTHLPHDAPVSVKEAVLPFNRFRKPDGSNVG